MLNLRIACLGLVLFVAFPGAADSRRSDVSVSRLRCEYLVNPLGIDVRKPRLSWILSSQVRGQAQTAYRVLVASTPEKLAAGEGDLWDSGKVRSNQSAQIVYAGAPLSSETRSFWKVRVWDRDGKPADWSGRGSWSMGLLEASDWQAQWIGPPPEEKDRGSKKPLVPPCPLLRKSFQVGDTVERATVYATALGCYELRINGRRVGDQVLAPEWTDYDRRVQYQTYDVTSMLRKGENAIGAVLADGWYLGRLGLVDLDPNFPRRGYYGKNRRSLLQLVIVYEDGQRQVVCSDGSWTCHADGPIRSADLFLGETYDAGKELPGWDDSGFDDSDWEPVVADRSVDKVLVAQMNEPIRVVKRLRSVGVSEPEPGIFVFDLGQNMVGWCRVELSGSEGTVVTLRHGEMLNPDGTVYVTNLRSADQVDRCVLGTRQTPVFEPHFTYHGFRYVQVEGLGRRPAADRLEGVVIASDARATGTFECSNPLLNRLWRNIVWTQRGNMHSTPTDCPQRSERMGWMGDAQICSQTMIFNMDMAAFFSKWITDIRDGQAADGRFPDFAPHIESSKNRFYSAPGWADGGIIVPWRMYVNYGDKRVLEEHYSAAVRYVDHVRRVNPDLLWRKDTGNNYSDWLNGDTIKVEDYPETGGALPREVLATAYFYRSTDLLARMASVLGSSDDARKYRDLASQIATAFNSEFVSDDVEIQGDTQSAYALALHFDILPASKRPRAVERLIAGIGGYDGRLSTGIQSTGRLMLELTRWGREDIAYRLAESRRCPSWLYMIDRGATTIWERWDGYVEGRGFQDAGMNSFNHYAFGAVGEWMVKTILGISPDEDRPGYEHILIRPRPGGSLRWARGSYESIRGEISVAWRTEGPDWLLDVAIPPNTTGTVSLPAKTVGSVKESGKALADVAYIHRVRLENDVVVFDIESGHYAFVVRDWSRK